MRTMIFGAGSDLGVHIDGASLGPKQLLNDLSSFYKGESMLFQQDPNIIKSRNFGDRRKNEYDVEKFNSALYKAIVEKSKEEYFPILIGGDHSVAIASALASAKVNTDVGIIWIDAHTDYNTFETTMAQEVLMMQKKITFVMQELPFSQHKTLKKKVSIPSWTKLLK